MKLPNRCKAVIEERKLVGYLLSPSHPYGRHKAALFRRFGFSAEQWQKLAGALLRHALQWEVAAVEESRFGTRYVIDGMMLTPDGRDPAICAIWFIEQSEESPKFITAYALRTN